VRSPSSRSDEDAVRQFWGLSTDLLGIAGFDGYPRRANPAAVRAFGYSEDELRSIPWLSLIHPDDLNQAKEAARTLLQGEPASTEVRVICKDGSIKWIEFAAIVRFDAQLVYAAGRDITERKRAEETLLAAEAALRESEARYRNLVERLPLVIYVDNVDALSSNIYTSPQTEWMLGYTAEEWRSDPELFMRVLHPDDQERIRATIGTGVTADYREEYRIVKPDGDTVWVLDSCSVIRDEDGRPLYAQGYLMDITARKNAEAESTRLEEALLESQRLESVGRLAGGIAHDYNNLLTTILGNVDLAGASPEGRDPEMQESLAEIRRAAERAAELTRQLLAVGRKQRLDPLVVDLNEIVTTVERFVHTQLDDRVDVTLSLARDLGPVNVDREQIERVLIELVTNSHAAMPGGGILAIETANVELDDAGAQAFGVEPGRYVSVAMRDTGVGMDEETIARIFEPFFTTHEQGQGSGLGLATAYGLVHQSGGGITAESDPTHGSTFTVVLPIAG
jgi:PAS domain S-box-containing protein